MVLFPREVIPPTRSTYMSSNYDPWTARFGDQFVRIGPKFLSFVSGPRFENFDGLGSSREFKIFAGHGLARSKVSGLVQGF